MSIANAASPHYFVFTSDRSELSLDAVQADMLEATLPDPTALAIAVLVFVIVLQWGVPLPLLQAVEAEAVILRHQ
jgi:hypothetical protein